MIHRIFKILFFILKNKLFYTSKLRSNFFIFVVNDFLNQGTYYKVYT